MVAWVQKVISLTQTYIYLSITWQQTWEWRKHEGRGYWVRGSPSPSSWHNQWLEAETSGNWQPHHLCARHQPARALTCITSLNPHSSAKRWILVIPLPQVGNPASGLKGFLRSQNRQRWKSSHPHAPGTSPHMFITTWFARERTSNVYRCFPQNN